MTIVERVMGIETEYAFSIAGRPPSGEAHDAPLTWMIARAGQSLPSLPGVQRNGLFLGNGSRLYVDVGNHMEMTTPECLSPTDVVRYRAAGELMLARLAEELAVSRSSYRGAAFYRCCVDYHQSSRSTWGCHESYLNRADPSQLRAQLIPHLVSRLVYTGAGGWDSLMPGLRFLLSPRSRHLAEVCSSESTSNRGICHTKDEPLCAGDYHRLHLLCGESLCSQRSSYLKVGTTALIVAMVEAGLRPGTPVQLLRPLPALHRFAADPTCTQAVFTIDGRSLTAIDVQRHYLAEAEAHLGAPFMPSWAEGVCREWRAMLDSLAVGPPESVADRLDWAMKLVLFRERIRRHGFSCEQIAIWNRVLSTILAGLRREDCVALIWDGRAMLAQNSPVANEVKMMSDVLKDEGETWDRLEPFLLMQQELFEADWRFGQLGKAGVFAALDETGLLCHRLEGVGDIEEGILTPPARGRAHTRGRCIQRLAPQRERFACNWSEIFDKPGRRVLRLGDPLVNAERWEQLPSDDAPGGTPLTPGGRRQGRERTARGTAGLARTVIEAIQRRRARSATPSEHRASADA